VQLRSGKDVESVIVSAETLSLVLRVRVRAIFVRRRIFFRNIISIENWIVIKQGEIKQKKTAPLIFEVLSQISVTLDD